MHRPTPVMTTTSRVLAQHASACADVGGSDFVAEWIKTLHLTQRSQVRSPLKAEKIGEKIV